MSNHNETLFEDVDGYKIAYHREGSGDPMILLHGVASYSFIWRNLVPPLSKNFEVISLDLLGCGESDKPTGVDYSIKVQAEIIKRLIEKLGLEKAHLVTHDIGGGIGQILVVKYPELFHSLVLINAIGYDFWPVQPIITMRIPFIRQLAMAIVDLGILAILVKRGIYHKDRANAEMIDRFLKPLRTTEGRRGFLQLAKSLNNEHLMEISDDLLNLTMPVLIIRGDADPYLGPEISKRLYNDITGAKLEIVETGGHYIQEDEPELLVEMIRTFIYDLKESR